MGLLVPSREWKTLCPSSDRTPDFTPRLSAEAPAVFCACT